MNLIVNKPVYNKDFLKGQIKSRVYEITNFYDKKVPKVDRL